MKETWFQYYFQTFSHIYEHVLASLLENEKTSFPLACLHEHASVIEYWILTLQEPTTQNGQIHSNDSSAVAKAFSAEPVKSHLHAFY